VGSVKADVEEIKEGKAMSVEESMGRSTKRQAAFTPEEPFAGLRDTRKLRTKAGRPAGLTGLVWAKPRTLGTPATSPA
jgi:hypothetical protein